MTLCIAARYPWGIMANLPGGPGPQAILFATDSRLTLRPTETTYDIAEKLFQVSENVGIVYAGNSFLGETCVDRLREVLSAEHPVEAEDVATIAKSLVNSIYGEFVHEHNSTPPLIFLLGTYEHRTHNAFLFGLENLGSHSFEAQELTGVKAIGSTLQIRELYRQKLEEFIEWRLSHGRGVSDNPLEWLNCLAIVLKRAVIESGIDPSVGGLVQTALIGRNGFSWVGQVKYELGKGWTESTVRTKDGWRLVDEAGREKAETRRLPWTIFDVAE